MVLSLLMAFGGRVMAQSASFNFSSGSQPITGWTNVAGDPSKAVRTATASSGITISSGSTANWTPDANGNSAYDGGGEAAAGFFAAAVMSNAWYQYGTTAASVVNSSQPQLIITGLHPDSIYTVRMSGSFVFVGSGLMMDPVLYTIMGANNYGTLQSNDNADVTDGAVFNNVVPDSTGTLKICVNTGDGSDVATISGLQIIPGQPTISGLTAGAGLAQYGNTLALGDSITGLGPHSFVSNRYQFLNGRQYSFGGSVNDPVARPVLRLYDNGDLAASTTMDTGVNTDAQTGLRFYSKLGILQIGATDRLDTAVNLLPLSPEGWPGGGILVNSDNSSDSNILRSPLFDVYVQGNGYDLDSTAIIRTSILNGQDLSISHGTFGPDLFNGYGLQISAPVDNSIVSGNYNIINKQSSVNAISGFMNSTQDTSRGSLVSGAYNQYGGLWQLVSGVYLCERTPGGTAFGSGNVDFTTLPYTGTQGLSTPNLASYPLFAIGNSSSYGGFKSNAVTVLYNGRTQINTTGFSTGLSQTAVTPQAALDVVSTNTGVLLPRLTTSQRNAIASADLQNGLLLYNTDSSSFQFYNGSAWNSVGGSLGAARWLVAGNGIYDTLDNIAIGTSNTQGYKLAVNGSAIFTRVVIKPQANWPDYVFDKGYKLAPLVDVERYVHAYHHLPGVPSGEEVNDKGIDVAAQESALLKKVEELTLYVIDLDKEVKGLESEHERLKAQVSRNHGQKSK